jgi:hypothetical protein
MPVDFVVSRTAWDFPEWAADMVAVEVAVAVGVAGVERLESMTQSPDRSASKN